MNIHPSPSYCHQNKGHASRPPARAFQSGFTLIEILAALIIMGITMTIIIVQLMPDERTLLREEADRLAMLLENAGIEAHSSGRSLAWSGEKSSYHFWKKNKYGDWIKIDDEALFRSRILPEGVHIGEVTVEEQVIKPGDYMQLNAASFSVPYRIRLFTEHNSASVTGKSTGTVIAVLDEQQPAAK